MGYENPNTPTDPAPSSSGLPESHKFRSVMIARIVGILCVAGGFVLGIQGLDQPDSLLLPTALGMLVAGMVAQAFALVRSWYLHSHRHV